MFDCIRCTRIVHDEESYLLFGKKYCRACALFIENSPEYEYIQELLKDLDQIEN